MNLYPNFSDVEYSLLDIACLEEIKYYVRFHMTSLVASPDGSIKQELNQTEQNEKWFGEWPGLKEKMDEAKDRNIRRYKALLQKIRAEDKEYTDQDIHWLKIMCQETIPQLKKHTIVKRQVNGTVSHKYAHIGLKAVIENAIAKVCEDYSKLADRLSKMDLIPGEGMQGPQRFRLDPGANNE